MLDGHAVAILYQALPPPLIDGLLKDAKPGGYSDSGADIGFCLVSNGLRVVAPVADPDPTRPLDWVFADTRAGIEHALGLGATLLWCNTILFEGHPVEGVTQDISLVGQDPGAMQAADDKFATNARLRAQALPVAASILASVEEKPGVLGVGALDIHALAAKGLGFPLILKPVRGRGSQGVTLVQDIDELNSAAHELIASGRFGDCVILEQFLDGAELTVTVLPIGASVETTGSQRFRALPPVLRFDHQDGVAPYNGDVAVSANSRALTAEEQATPQVQALIEACLSAAAVIDARAAIRIDCRADRDGMYRLFDLNMKPNMTGTGRPGRDDQDSLSLIAARAIGWSYADLLMAMLHGAWRPDRA